MRKPLRGAVLLVFLLTPWFGGCSTHGMVTNVQQFRIGMGGNELGNQVMHQYYVFFGLWRLNEVDIQQVAADYTSYDVTTGCSWTDWLMSLFLLPLTVTRSSVRVDY